MQGKKKNTGPGKLGLSDLEKYEVIDSVRLDKYPSMMQARRKKENKWIMKYRSQQPKKF